MVTSNRHHAGESPRSTKNQQAKNHSTSRSRFEPSPPISIRQKHQLTCTRDTGDYQRTPIWKIPPNMYHTSYEQATHGAAPDTKKTHDIDFDNDEN
jgi:hypothetical protein